MHTSDNERIALVAAKKYEFLEDALPRYWLASPYTVSQTQVSELLHSVSTQTVRS